jgi:enterochelin esterase family protein
VNDDAAGLLPAGPHLDPATGAVTFIVDAAPGVRPLSVWFHLRDFGADTGFRPRAGRWVAQIPRPPVDRMEYLLVVLADDGATAMVPDPANPHRAAGVFGEHSLLEFPAYAAPPWLAEAGGRTWTRQPLRVEDSGAGIEVTGELCSPRGSEDEPLPLLVVHDGPEYERLARLLDYLALLADRDPALRCRALLLQPVERDRSYSASPAYARALVERAIPRALALAPTEGPVVGAGASLGALALMHAAVTYPGSFGGVFAQSGSFFLPRFDAHEQRFAFYRRVVDFVERLDAEPERLAGLRVAQTSGQGEENLDNNRALEVRLRRRGVDSTLTEGRDGHNYTAWRDLLDPALGDLLTRVWGIRLGE